MSPPRSPFVYPTYDPPILPPIVVPQDNNHGYPEFWCPSRASDDQQYFRFSDNALQPRYNAPAGRQVQLDSPRTLFPEPTFTDHQRRGGSQVDYHLPIHEQPHQPAVYHPHHEEGQLNLQQPHQTPREYPSHGYQAAHHVPNAPHHQPPRDGEQTPQPQYHQTDISHQQPPNYSLYYQQYPHVSSEPHPSYPQGHHYHDSEHSTAHTQVWHPHPHQIPPQPPALIPSSAAMNPHPHGAQLSPSFPHGTMPCLTGEIQRSQEHEALEQQRSQALLRARFPHQSSQVQSGNQAQPVPVSHGSQAPQMPEQGTLPFPTSQGREFAPQQAFPDMPATVQGPEVPTSHQTGNFTPSATIHSSPLTMRQMPSPNIYSPVPLHPTPQLLAQTLDSDSNRLDQHNFIVKTAQEAMAVVVQMHSPHPPPPAEAHDVTASVGPSTGPSTNGDGVSRVQSDGDTHMGGTDHPSGGVSVTVQAGGDVCPTAGSHGSDGAAAGAQT